MLRRVGRTPAGQSDVFPDVFRHYRHLIHGIVELLRRPSVEPVCRRRGIWRGDRIDIR